MEYATSIAQPVVSSFSGAHSIDQLAAAAKGSTYTMELGIDVDHGLFPQAPEKSHLFIYVNKDNYSSSEDCYDCNFVPFAEAKMVPGMILEPSSSKLILGVKYYQGNWWVWAGTQWIGYVPGSFWGGHFISAESEDVYGEVFDARIGSN